jgi:hypothetical protein
MSWENLRQTYMSVLASEGFRPELDGDGDIHFKYEGGHYYVTDNCDDGFFYILFPGFWSIDTGDELARAALAVNTATRDTKAAKVYITRDLKRVSATFEGLVGSSSDVPHIINRALRCIRTAVRTFMDEMAKEN